MRTGNRLKKQGGNTICYEQDVNLREQLQQALRATPGPVAHKLKLQCCLPLLPGVGSPIKYGDIFRVVIMHFMDIRDLDLRSLKRSCAHIVNPNGHVIPFETYNLRFIREVPVWGVGGKFHG